MSTVNTTSRYTTPFGYDTAVNIDTGVFLAYLHIVYIGFRLRVANPVIWRKTIWHSISPIFETIHCTIILLTFMRQKLKIFSSVFF